jgi:hypothetical protein
MAGAPNTRNWKANELPDFIGRRYQIHVSGDVQVTATNRTPKLSYRNPQGINPRILMLNLTIVSSGGFGGQIVFYKSVQYAKTTSGNQYDEVDILYRGKVIQRIKVGHPKTLAKRTAKKKKAGRKKRL